MWVIFAWYIRERLNRQKNNCDRPTFSSSSRLHPEDKWCVNGSAVSLLTGRNKDVWFGFFFLFFSFSFCCAIVLRPVARTGRKYSRLMGGCAMWGGAKECKIKAIKGTEIEVGDGSREIKALEQNWTWCFLAAQEQKKKPFQCEANLFSTL